jgi:hypothetical protein
MPLPDGLVAPEIEFQTKSIWCSMDLFTITEAGRLIYHCRRYEADVPCHGYRDMRIVPVGDIDMEYHGDLLVHGTTSASMNLDYVVRFAHGTVEWIRALGEMSEIHRRWLLDRGQ